MFQVATWSLKLFQQAGVNQRAGFVQGTALTALQINVQHTDPVGTHALIVTPLGGFAINDDDSAVVLVGIKYRVAEVELIFLQLPSAMRISLAPLGAIA